MKEKFNNDNDNIDIRATKEEPKTEDEILKELNNENNDDNNNNLIIIIMIIINNK